MKSIAGALNIVGWVAASAVLVHMFLDFFGNPLRAVAVCLGCWAAAWAVRHGVVWWKRNRRRLRANV